ncbi:hypothetical protein AU210_016765, partial [Fusarium oxysporum f. sp. radicis-cucumerinum]
YGDDVELDLVQVPSLDEDWVYLACENDHPAAAAIVYATHDCIFIAVDGACRGNGTPDAKAAIGVFVGETSSFNRSLFATPGTRDEPNRRTERRIVALEQALEILRTKALGEEPLHKVVIKADSEYLVKGMTEWVFKWETTGI